jgi:hypothetical protein
MSYEISTNWTIILVLCALWELAWKGWALWKAGRLNQPAWFIALLLINSLGLLPVIYITRLRLAAKGL